MSITSENLQSYNQNAHLYAGKMRSGKNYGHLFIEKPAMSAQLDKLGDLKDKKILALGCGSGEEIELLISRGAKPENIIGVDGAEKLVEIAKINFPEIDFRVMRIEELDLIEGSFDLVYSSLVMHYVEDWEKPLEQIYKMLNKSGQFLFSTHHPMSWGAQSFEVGEDYIKGIGYKTKKLANIKNDKLVNIEVIGNYLTTVQNEAKWFGGKMKIIYFNRSISEILYSLKKVGFNLNDFLEPKPINDLKEKDFELWKIHNEIPLFIVGRVSKSF